MAKKHDDRKKKRNGSPRRRPSRAPGPRRSSTHERVENTKDRRHRSQSSSPIRRAFPGYRYVHPQESSTSKHARRHGKSNRSSRKDKEKGQTGDSSEGSQCEFVDLRTRSARGHRGGSQHFQGDDNQWSQQEEAGDSDSVFWKGPLPPAPMAPLREKIPGLQREKAPGLKEEPIKRYNKSYDSYEGSEEHWEQRQQNEGKERMAQIFSQQHRTQEFYPEQVPYTRRDYYHPEEYRHPPPFPPPPYQSVPPRPRRHSDTLPPRTPSYHPRTPRQAKERRHRSISRSPSPRCRSRSRGRSTKRPARSKSRGDRYMESRDPDENPRPRPRRRPRSPSAHYYPENYRPRSPVYYRTTAIRHHYSGGYSLPGSRRHVVYSLGLGVGPRRASTYEYGDREQTRRR